MIPIAKPTIGKEEEKAVIKIIRSGKLVQGEKVEEFEKKIASYCGTKFAIATDNGTSALIVALTSVGVGLGDEVITTPLSFIATTNAIVFTGAKPVFVDIDPDTFNIDPGKIERAITSKTRAILPVHLYGLMADMESINKIAKKHNLLLVEDSAQAHGAEIRGKRAGSWGLAGCFSFYPSKNMTTSEGGMITTNSKQVAEACKLIRNQGMGNQYQYKRIGYNFRMTNIEAAIGVEQLKKLERMNKARAKNAIYLNKKFENTKGVGTPQVPKNYRHAYHQYTLKIDDNYSLSRDQLLTKLRKNGVDARVYYPKLLSDEPFFKQYDRRELNIAKSIHRQILSLPIHPSLTRQDLDKIVEVVNET
ncbi:MAG: aminotransferase DegT [Candidatus Woykebacteria bacterium RBG_19FT_COMBO_43_10]|uniref:Aminotransferase DegT n=1 Tax=Candidatus Woykebacteria bacterium RBG_19FT_COMBO_43_10 TaxID=1802598 RepID=A0A1G1WIP7_9BACT|nr:MAG: aminotransferase DegT [Candidatus Woykebacteria bacterium RBG_19FT_COMBO_43_10]